MQFNKLKHWVCWNWKPLQNEWKLANFYRAKFSQTSAAVGAAAKRELAS